MYDRHRLVMISVLIMMVISLVPVVPAGGQAGQADLSVSPADITFSNDSPDSGEVVTIEVTVHNAGPAAATNVVVGFYMDGLIIPPTKSIGAIQAGSTGETSHQWMTPIPGEYTIGVSVEADQGDPDIANNEAERNITVGTVVPTIIVTADLGPSTIQSKAPFWANGTAEMGGEPVNSGIVKVEVVTEGISNESVTSSDGTFAVMVPGPVRQGGYEIKVTVTQGVAIGETILNLTVLQPDVTITTFSFNPSSPRAGDNVKVKVGVQNLGNGTAKAVKFILNIDGELAFEKDLGDLSNGQTQVVIYNWKAKKGSHTFQAVLDPDDTIEEYDEDDNKRLEDLEVRKAKDDEPTPSFEALVFVMAVTVIFLLLRNGKGRRGR